MRITYERHETALKHERAILPVLPATPKGKRKPCPLTAEALLLSAWYYYDRPITVKDCRSSHFRKTLYTIPLIPIPVIYRVPPSITWTDETLEKMRQSALRNDEDFDFDQYYQRVWDDIETMKMVNEHSDEQEDNQGEGSPDEM